MWKKNITPIITILTTINAYYNLHINDEKCENFIPNDSVNRPVMQKTFSISKFKTIIRMSQKPNEG